jgi:hypothetical protein
MQQFTVPQFIDVEDKIIGPITTRQFVELLAAILLDFLVFKLATFYFFLFWLVLITGSAMVLAFATMNGQPFHFFLLNVIQTLKKPSLRVWYIDPKSEEIKISAASAPKLPVKVEMQKERPAASKLSDLSLLVNTGGVYRAEE